MDEKEEVKETTIQIRVSFEEKAIIERCAREAGMKVSEWMRIRSMSTGDFYEVEE